MFLKVFLQQLICFILLHNRLSSCQPIIPDAQEEHVNNQLRHYLKRLEVAAQKANDKFTVELQNLVDKFKRSLAKESLKEKSSLLEQHTKSMDFAEFLSTEIDRQYINEDILIESWYLNEILPYVTKDLYDETVKILHDLKEAYRTDDLDKKFDIYTDIGEYMTDEFLNYFYGEDEPVPLLKAHLKYYLEYLQYLLRDYEMDGQFERNAQELFGKVKRAYMGENTEEMVTVINLFDDLSTKFGRYLDEHFADFKMFKFGE